MKFLNYNMHVNKIVFLGIIVWIIPVITVAQNATNSPYTRYGYGILADKAFISQRGMGGIGYGLRSSQLINPMNPASFSAVDSMTFMFDLGVTGQVSWFSDAFNSEHKLNGNLEYIAFQFSLAKKMGIGVGLEPVSFVGYNYADTTRLPVENELVQNTFSGRGGLSRVYAALGYDFLNRFSVGVKLSYLYGDITHSNLITFNSINNYNTNWTDTIRSYGFLYDFGLQYHHPVGKFKTVTIGAVYSPKISFGTKVMTGFFRVDPSSGAIMERQNTVSRDSVFEMPETFGLGFTYNQLGKFTVGADVLYQRWSSAKYYDQTGAFNNSVKLNAGGEFIPNRTSGSLLKKIRYRAGLYYTDSYLKVNDSKYNEYGANLGLGIPMSDRRSLLNIAFEYSLIRPESKALIDEQYFKVSLSYTFNELWFFKQRVQ
ncbi:MAG: hypothetical protein FWF53_08320 [Candidatus Azobacteroides sp.]|nr:hypothetical protein [Candidatus Azobacteroides sp.]